MCLPPRSFWLTRSLRLRYRRETRGESMFKHMRPQVLRSLLGEAEWSRYFKFCFVRNPWSRAVSLYHFHRKNPDKARWALAQESFDDWVRGGGTGTAQSLMSDFIRDPDGRVLVDFVGRYENLTADFHVVCERLKLPRAVLPHLNQSTTGDYRQLYTNETRDIVALWCARDIAEFGYEF